jgi:hypothetical protein
VHVAVDGATRIAYCEVLGDERKEARPLAPTFTADLFELGIRHLRTRAYGRLCGSSRERTAALSSWLRFYDHQRPHSALARQTPAAQLACLLGNNIMASHF